MIVKSDGKEQVRIVDFGIAKIVAGTGDSGQKLTQTGEIFGSPFYMSPEQCSGAAIDRRADIYSLGCVMYEALSGQPPHCGENVYDTIHKHLNTPPPPLVAPQIDEQARQKLEVILLRCLAKLPDDRYPSMRELESELRSLSLKSRPGMLAALGGAWNLASAKRRAARQSKIPVLAIALGASLLSVVMLLYELRQADAQIQELGYSRKVMIEISLAQSDLILFAEATRRYVGAATFMRSSVPMTKRKFDNRRQQLELRMEGLEKLLQSNPESDGSIYESKKLREKLNEVPNAAKVTTDEIEKSKSFGMFGMGVGQLSVINHITEVCEDAARALDSIAREAARQEDLQMRQFTETERQVGLLSIICASINGIVIISLIVYFGRGTQDRLRKLAENAIRLSRKRRPESQDNHKDEVADLDSVLQELATALNEAEEREKVLLQKLQLKDKNPGSKP
jgi:hypothetical protein